MTIISDRKDWIEFKSFWNSPVTKDISKITDEEKERLMKEIDAKDSFDMSELEIIARQAIKLERLDLARVYVDLLTTSQELKKQRQDRRQERALAGEEQETQPLSALQAVIDHRRIVLLGDPGSGKSTFLIHLALCLAGYSLTKDNQWTTRLPDWNWQEEGSLVPVVCILRDFARWLPDGVAQAQERHVWDFLTQRLASQNLGAVIPPLHDALEHGHVVLLFDGLDEIPSQEQRSFIRDAVAVFAKRYPQCRVVVTCRTLSYQDPAWQLADFASCTLAPFSEQQIDRFISAWYGELVRTGTIKPEAVKATSLRLQEAVRRPDLWRLASNPLLLTTMALVHTHKGRLPDARAMLYEEAIDMLLWRWEQVKVSTDDAVYPLQSLLAEANRSDVDLKRVLWQLAFEAHRAGGTVTDEDNDKVADIGELSLTKALSQLHPNKSRDWAAQVIEVIKLRAGLLLERESEVYTFPHRTFQEYLAGAYLSSEPDFAQHATQLAAEGALWREVILLAVGRLVYLSGDTAKPLTLVAELCPAQSTNTDIAWRQAWLAGDVLLEMGRNRVADSRLGWELAERVGQRLVDLLQKERLSPVERAAAGDTLGRLGDPRFRTDAWSLPDEGLLGFVEIEPSQQYLLGLPPV